MATRIHTVLIDDIDGGDAEETVSFGLDGKNYEIDLSTANAKRLREALDEFIGFARSAGRSGARTTKKAPAASASGSSSREIRDWARSNGYTVPDRGRVPSEIVEAFESRTAAKKKK